MSEFHDAQGFVESLSSHSSDQDAIETNFGSMLYQRSNVFYFADPIIGFADVDEYALLAMPNDDFKEFILLQSITRPDLSFVALPFYLENDFYEKDDLTKVCNDLNLDAKSTTFLSIVSLKNDAENIFVNLNLRAPIFLDLEHQRAYQRVLENPNYPIRYQMAAIKITST